MAITYRFRPGERINEVDLARQLNVSRTPLREALNRLATEGFLTATPNRGFFARPLDTKVVFDLYEFRRCLEVASARLACERATDVQLDELEAFVRASRDEKEDAQAIKLLRLDEEFHERVANLTGNEEILRSLRSINARIHFIRWIDMQNGRRTHTQAEHLRIVRALKARNAEEASGLMQDHISRRLDQIVEVIRAGFAEIYMGNALAKGDQSGGIS
jgi:DNA-binding GntR family transcriptional regulator